MRISQPVLATIRRNCDNELTQLKENNTRHTSGESNGEIRVESRTYALLYMIVHGGHCIVPNPFMKYK